MFARTKEIAAAARLGGGRACAGRRDRRREDRPQFGDCAVALWLDDALSILASQPSPGLPRMLIFERTDGAPRLVGSCGLS